MINKVDDCEYSLIIADLMVLLSKCDEFIFKIWVNSRELPFIFDETYDITFSQEGIIAVKENRVNMIFYDTWDNVQVIRDAG